MSERISFPSFNQSQAKAAQSDIAKNTFRRALSIEGQSTQDDAVKVKIGADSIAAASAYDKKAKPVKQSVDVAAQAQAAPKPKASESSDVKPKEAPPVFEGVYENGTAEFGGVTLRLEENGVVNAFIKTPDGKEIKGEGFREKDGRTVVTLENGQTYSANLTIEGGKAKISDLKLVEQGAGERPSRDDGEDDLQVTPG